MSTKIEWTDETWQVVTGCTKVSEGCRHCYAHCYAERLWPRLRRGRPFSEVQTHPEKLGQPLRWRKPRKVFVCSMGDLFHPGVPFEFVEMVYAAMALSPQHTFIVPTKRPQRRLEFFEYEWRDAMVEGQAQKMYHERTGEDPSMWLAVHFPLPNVWELVSVEDQPTADERILILQRTPAAVRGVSLEPMLGPVNMRFALASPGLDWAIVGAESGPKARPCEDQWIRDVVDQCTRYDTALFVKQKRDPLGGGLIKMPKIDGRVWDQYPVDISKRNL